MTIQINPFPLLGVAAGLAMLVFGLLRRSKAAAVTSAPLRPSGGLAPGVRQVISGRADAPVVLRSPVTGRDCAFFLKELEVARRIYTRRGYRTSWVMAESSACGFFFVDDTFGRALVFPTYDSLDLCKPSEVEGSIIAIEGESRVTEQVILQGEVVTVLGSPRPLSEFIAWARGNLAGSLPAAGLEKLLEMAKDPAGAATPCFYGRDLSLLADRSYPDYISWKTSSASSYIWGGVAVALVSAWIFIQPFLAAGQRTVQ